MGPWSQNGLVLLRTIEVPAHNFGVGLGPKVVPYGALRTGFLVTSGPSTQVGATARNAREVMWRPGSAEDRNQVCRTARAG